MNISDEMYYKVLKFILKTNKAITPELIHKHVPKIKSVESASLILRYLNEDGFLLFSGTINEGVSYKLVTHNIALFVDNFRYKLQLALIDIIITFSLGLVSGLIIAYLPKIIALVSSLSQNLP